MPAKLDGKTTQRVILKRCEEFSAKVEDQARRLAHSASGERVPWHNLAEAVRLMRAAATDCRRIVDEDDIDLDDWARTTADDMSSAYHDAIEQARERSRARRRDPLGAEREPTVVFQSSHFDISEVLQFLSDSRKTGEVRIACLNETATVEIDDGRILDATSTNTPDQLRLGQILIRQGAITDTALFKFIVRHTRGGRRLGRALWENEVVRRDAVMRALRHQVIELICRCLSEPDACVEFRAYQRQRRVDDTSFDLAEILLEGVASLDRTQRTPPARPVPALQDA